MASRPYNRLPRPVEKILSEEAARLSLEPRTLRTKGKSGQISLARRRAAVRLRSLGFSYPQIGAIFGLHHTSVMYMVRRSQQPQQALKDAMDLYIMRHDVESSNEPGTETAPSDRLQGRP